MCGIVGVFNLKNDTNCVIDRQLKGFAMNFFLTELLLPTEERGTDATGYFAMFEDGNSLGLKHSVKASEFIYGSSFPKGLNYQEHMKALEKYHNETSPIKAIIGHCRKSTVGSHKNINNHPIVLDNEIAVVHNGTFSNRDKVVELHKEDFTPVGEVDSEMIAQLARLWQKQNEPDFNINTLEFVKRRLDGGIASFVISSKTDKVMWFKYDRPLFFAYLRDLGMLVAASERKFIETAVELFKRLKVYQVNIPNFKFMISPAGNNKAGIIDLDKPVEEMASLTVQKVDTLTGETSITLGVLPEYKEDTYSSYSYNTTTTRSVSTTNNVSNTTSTTTTKNKTTTTPATTDNVKVKTTTSPKGLIRVMQFDPDSGEYTELLMIKTAVYADDPEPNKGSKEDKLRNKFKSIGYNSSLSTVKTTTGLNELISSYLPGNKSAWTASSAEIAQAAEVYTLKKLERFLKKYKKAEKSARKSRRRIISLKKFLSALLCSTKQVEVSAFDDYNLSKEDYEFVLKLVPERVWSKTILAEYINKTMEDKRDEARSL